LLLRKSGFGYTDIVKRDSDSFLVVFQFLPFYAPFQVVINEIDLGF